MVLRLVCIQPSQHLEVNPAYFLLFTHNPSFGLANSNPRKYLACLRSLMVNLQSRNLFTLTISDSEFPVNKMSFTYTNKARKNAEVD